VTTVLDRLDRHIHRCDECGTWVYADQPCTTCQTTTDDQAEEADQ